MFSRNNNTKENYSLEQKQNSCAYNYIFYHSKVSPKLQGNGLGIAKIHPSMINENYIDIDSELKGIGSCNFIEPQYKVQYNPNHIKVLDLYEKNKAQPLNTSIYYQNERPFYT
uniref:Uncharacterized protein n=1 Tax=viral metagenome TaxID=1070528 RepID=A0A6C0HRQ2_9ZZZZ